MTKEQWKMNRAGLVNFWYYDQETFQFEDGKLLLRGANGSGKSVTMQSFLPVLLDGRKSPDRLDPFGSKARKMEDYLLGEKEISKYDERTGYLFLEYVKEETGQYMTTGIGMQAKRNKQMKSWYFVLTDNRRIGHDFSLVQEHTGETIPLSEKELSNRIGTGGYVTNSQRDYMELVNRHVFGFQSVEAYEDLIKLLIQLRSPKLSKDFKPTVIYEILESALPPLTDDEIRTLSDSIDHMDQAQLELEMLADQKRSIIRLLTQYDRYNRFIIAERTKQWLDAKEKAAIKQRETAAHEDHINELTVNIRELEEQQNTLLQQEKFLEGEIARLRGHEVFDLQSKKVEVEKDLKDKKVKLASLEQKHDSKQRDYTLKRQQRETVDLILNRIQHEINDLFQDMEAAAEESDFRSHALNRQDYERMAEGDYDFKVWFDEVEAHHGMILELSKMLEEKQRLQRESAELERKSSEHKQHVDHTRQQIEHTQQWFTEELQMLESSIFGWIGQRRELVFTNEDRQQLARSIQGLYEANGFDQVKEQLNEKLNHYRLDLNDQIREKQSLHLKLTEEMETLQEEIKRLKQQKMIEPDRAEGTASHRLKLKESGKAAIPFYEAVEFQENLPEKTRSRLESALRQTGILDSLITDGDLSPNEDAFLNENPLMMTETLADYLKPDLEEGSGVSAEKVDAVLRSIPLEHSVGAFSIDLDGSYSVGIMKGHAPVEGAPKFIGRASRKRYLKEQLERLIDDSTVLEEQTNLVKEEIVRLQEKLAHVKAWQGVMPSDQLLRDIDEQLQDFERELKVHLTLLEEADHRWKDVQVKLADVKQRIYPLSSQLSFDPTPEHTGEALQAIKDYQKDLYSLKDARTRLVSNQRELSSLQDNLEERVEELDELNGDINVEAARIEKLIKDINAMEQQMQLKGMDEVRREISRVVRQIDENKAALNQVRTQLPKKDSLLDREKEKLADSKIETDFWIKLSHEWHGLVQKETGRKFPTEYEADLTLLDQIDKPKLLEQLTKAYQDELTTLSEYRLENLLETTELPVWMQEEQYEKFDGYSKVYEALKDRRIIRVYFNGSQTDPYYLSEAITKNHEEQDRNLDEQDRKLYEDIMLNHIGTILRSRIRRAKQWVKKMDQIMAERDNSSGLIFSIAWKARTAEAEGEMDTVDLVSLLERDSKYLREEDLTKITRHFKSRIARAKELITIRNEGSTLHQVLKEVLDYRKWYSFVLSYKRENETGKRELTNNAFFQFSGGEKAMAMYIPLFTAAYSRYKEAGDAAPYIVSLDEAFAGVDENNIRDMFEVVEQLGFNYIMNSQALWGDYDTVPALSIAELLRPKNADFVTVMRYKWDGIKREPVQMEEEMIHEQYELT